MELTLREVAWLLKQPEETVVDWVRDGSLPARRVQNQYRFNRAELLEFVTANRMQISADLLQQLSGSTPRPLSLTQALRLGGVLGGLEGPDKRAVLRALVETRLPLADEDRRLLLPVLMAREELASTGIGEGIAIPHVREPIVLHIGEPLIALCYLSRPVEFGAIDGLPVHALFTLLSPTVRDHLQLLSRLAFALRDEGFKAAVKRQAGRDDILREAERIDELLAQRPAQARREGASG